jgi:winged helix DNA-binding protein
MIAAMARPARTPAPAVTTAVVRERLTAQLLAGEPATTPAEVAGRLLAVQAQDPRGIRLAIRARTRGLSAAGLDEALTSQRSVLITWLNRGTLHLVRSEDYWWLHPLTAPRMLTGVARRLAQEGVPPDDAERGVAVIERSLAGEGPLTRAQLAERIAAAGVRTQGQALIHLLALASVRGIAIRGPVAGRQHAYALTRDWLGPPPGPFDRDRALAELARRYLAGHGPATEADLATWAGLPLRDARRGLSQIAPLLGDQSGGLARLAGAPAAAALPPPKLLGPFEPVLLGWSSREFITAGHAGAIAVGGVFRSFALAGGRAVATWGLADGKVTLSPLREFGPRTSAALAADAADVMRFLGEGAPVTPEAPRGSRE